MKDREAFLTGERPGDVLIYLADAVIGDPAALADVGDPVENGVVLVVSGEEGRRALQGAVGVDPMAFAADARDTTGAVDRDCTAATCPAADGDEHKLRFLFAFVEAEHADAGGPYAEGDVCHAYAQCSCGERYADRWVIDTT